MFILNHCSLRVLLCCTFDLSLVNSLTPYFLLPFSVSREEVLACLEEEQNHRAAARAQLEAFPSELKQFQRRVEDLTDTLVGIEDTKSEALWKCEQEINALRSQLASTLS